MSVCVWVGGGMALWLMCACAWGVICGRGVCCSRRRYKLVRSQTCVGSRIPRTTHIATPVCAHAAGVRARASTSPTLPLPLSLFPIDLRTPDLLPHTDTHSNLPYPPIRPFPPLIENSTTGRHCSGQKLCESEETIYGSNRCVVTSDQYGGFSCKRKKEVVTA